MGSPNAKNVAIGKPLATGGVLKAPLTTALPISEAAALLPAHVAVGYISDAGVTESTSTDSSSIVAWGGDTVRKVQTSHDVTYAFEMIEVNGVSTGIYYGEANVVATVAGPAVGAKLAIKVTAAELLHFQWVLEISDGLRRGRIILPDGQVTERGDVTYLNDDAVKYPVTVTAYPDATGTKAYIFWNDGVFVP
ncbi:hypothetical protein SAMN04515671_2917 [Nakamurella panacisegetis]|uniref:Uncharacterized protein n=1 Tax=Nakamurella panacisegetis TaxID=1090615 RepID=A0A1H0PVV5_9ACTN|nr:hypothetical protein [Nakamurella panacisegetis]SDP09154.1 hypothetical protein SAMN04515671_2917 [Nakamurella panacisegetis]